MKTSSKKKVIIINYKEFENFEYEKYGGMIFEKNFDVEAWNLSKIFFNVNIDKKYLYPKQKRIESIRELITCLKDYDRKRTSLVLLMLPADRRTFYLEAVVSILRFSYSMIYPQPCLAQWNTGSLKEYWAQRKPDYVNAILNTLFPPAFNFLATETCYKEFPSLWSVKRQRNILIHTLDYDVYLKVKKEKERLIDDKYILFLDENYVEHKAFQVLGVGSPFREAEDYYKPIRHFLDQIEKLFGCPVVIAVHPRSHYLDQIIYGNRRMIQGQTARLIKDAEMVLCHKTLAMDYIILFKKNFLVIYLDELMRFYLWDSYYIPFFQYLKIQGLNISKFYDESLIKSRIVSGLSKECKKYEQYYIKARGTEDRLFFEIVAQYILSAMSGEKK